MCSKSMYVLIPEKDRARPRSHRCRSNRTIRSLTDDGFPCIHCKTFVVSANLLSGVRNRNHCPYCLWSRHMDLHEAGDRLSACKAPMRPIGLTIKTAPKKYGTNFGELLLIHMCMGCGDLSINRIAADDDAVKIFSTYEDSHAADVTCLEGGEIRLLTPSDHQIVRARLFGERG